MTRRLSINTVMMTGATLLFLLMGIVPVYEASAEEESSLRILTLHAEPAPSPLLKYRLLPTFDKKFPGNAAVFYGKVFAEQQALLDNHEYWRKSVDLLSEPLDQISDNKVVWQVVTNDMIFDSLRRASYADTCDWQVLRSGEPYYSTLLPELQQTRQFVRLLALRARYQIAQGDYDAAVVSLQSAFAAARNASVGQTLVHPMVASAMVHELFEQLLVWTEQPNAPNLYWALTALPEPIIEFRTGLEINQFALPRSFPVFENIDSDDFSSDYWSKQLAEVWEGANDELDHVAEQPLPSLEMMAFKLYPIAKRELIKAGNDAERINAMPVARVVLMYEYRKFQQKIEDRYSLTFLPYPQAIERLGKLPENNSPSDLISLLSPFEFSEDFEQLLGRQARAEMEIALLRTIEAIRMYAADNDGRLPASLSEIKIVAVPNDPMSGEPFVYQSDGETASISPARLTTKPNRFEINIAKEQK